MLLTDEEVNTRLASPLNLLNRLRRETSSNSPLLPSTSVKSQPTDIVSIPATIDDIIDNLDDKLAAASTSRQASMILKESLNELSGRLNEISRPEKLAAIAKDMSNIVATLKEDKKDNGNTTNIVVYTPTIIREELIESIIVAE